MKPQEIITKLLGQIAEEQGFITELQLGTFLGVSTVTLWRWRNGFLDKSTKVLVPILWERITAVPEPA